MELPRRVRLERPERQGLRNDRRQQGQSHGRLHHRLSCFSSHSMETLANGDSIRLGVAAERMTWDERTDGRTGLADGEY